MKTKFIEATNIDAGGGNHGKFMVARFTEEEWQRRSDVEPGMLTFLQRRRWTPDNILVVDLETGEGAIFKPGGYAKADLEKHKIWVCPMAEKFLEWLYTQDLTDLDNLPGVVQIADPTTSLYGYRRPGPGKTYVTETCTRCGTDLEREMIGKTTLCGWCECDDRNRARRQLAADKLHRSQPPV